jgi:hypothetical protein
MIDTRGRGAVSDAVPGPETLITGGRLAPARTVTLRRILLRCGGPGHGLWKALSTHDHGPGGPSEEAGLRDGAYPGREPV